MGTQASFEQSLEHCLQELARTDDVEASLQRYPQHADRLRPLLEMAQATRYYYKDVPEAPGGLAVGREQMLAAAAQQRARGVSATSTSTTRSWKMRLALSTRLIAVLLIVVLGTAALGSGVVWAAQDSLPGDLLYPVKLVTEDLRLALASGPANQVDLALQFVEERAGEVQALAAAGRPIPGGTVARMEGHIERALTQAAWAPDEETAGLLTQITARTRTQQQGLEQAQATAPQQTQARLERAVIACREGAEAAEHGLSDPQTFRWRYRDQHGAPEPTREPEQMTATPADDEGRGREGTPQQNQERDQQQDREGERTPHVTPQGPQATAAPQVTPQGPQATSVPQVTPEGPQATAAPQVTPQGPQATSMPQVTPQGPQVTAAPQVTPQDPQGPPDTPQSPRATSRRP